jgi:hypothetical protein
MSAPRRTTLRPSALSRSPRLWRSARTPFGVALQDLTPLQFSARPDGYVAWVGDRTQLGLADALTTWFGPPTAA